MTKKFSCYILVDISSHVDGYASDLTRVFHIGPVPELERRMAQVASDCVIKAKEAVKPGVAISEINRICERVIRNSDFADYLLHSSGHSIGLNVVEHPFISEDSKETLKPNMVLALENGVYPHDLNKGPESIYLSFRMEDIVLVTNDGAQWLSGPGLPVIEL